MSALAKHSSLVSVRPAHSVSSNGHKLCRLVLEGLLTTSCFHALTAFADDKETCSNARDRVQTLRAAREPLRACATTECSAPIQRECTAWLKDGEARLSSVVLVSRNAAGSELHDVSVTMDGFPLAIRPNGLVFEVDPGTHTFTFEGPDGKAEQKLVIGERVTALRISVTLGQGETAPIVADTPPREADESECGKAYAEAEVYHQSHKLTGARKALVACSRKGCPASVQKECADELTEVNTVDAALGMERVFPSLPVENGLSFGLRTGLGIPFGLVSSHDHDRLHRLYL